MKPPEPLSVLMVLESLFPSPNGGGAESQLRTLGKRLTADGVCVSIVVPLLAHGPQARAETIDGIAVRRIAYRHVPWYGAASLLLQLVWLLWRTRRRYDVIHAHIAGNMAAVCSLMGWLLNKPVIVKLTGLTEMSGGVLDAAPGIGSRVRRRLLKLACAYQATSSRIGRLLVERGFAPQKVRLIPNAVDTWRFRRMPRDTMRRRELLGDAKRVGIYVGRLEAEKGLELLLNAWAKVFGGRRDATLLIVGGGRLRQPLEALAETLGIASIVVFVGPSECVEQYLALADFALLTSMYEGLSNTMLECMSAGLPMIGSRVSGTEDFVRDGDTGFSFPPGNVDALAACLAAMRDLDDAELASLGSRACSEVTSKASIEAVIGNLMRAYRAPLAVG